MVKIMGSFYENKTKAYAIIDKMVANKAENVRIYFKIATKFGFSEKFVDKRIEELKKFIERSKKS